MSDARHIYQSLLDDLTGVIQARDLASLCDSIDLPYEFRTLEGTVVYRTRSELEQAIDTYLNALNQRGVTDIQRVCDTAQFLGGGRISGYHTTRAMRGDTLDAQPFLTRMNLVETDGEWRISICDNSLRSADWTVVPGFYEIPGHGAPKSHGMSDTAARLHLFQTFLDRISAALVAGDAEGWLGSMFLPCHLVTRDGVETFDTPEQVYADFERYRQDIKTCGITHILREAKTAEIIGGDQMVGTYTTHLLRGSKHVVPPWDGSMTLRCENGLWRATTVMRAVGHLNWQALEPADTENTLQDTPPKGESQ